MIRRCAVLVWAIAAGACASAGGHGDGAALEMPRCQKEVGVRQDELEQDRAQLLSLHWLPADSGYEVVGTQPPKLVNKSKIFKMLESRFPRRLRNAGINGVTRFYVLIDEEGRVARSQMEVSSGYLAYDRVAAKVVASMQFAPAVHGACRLPFWAELPIVFQVFGAAAAG
ncbi:MAG: TonB family protein [Gemmatimonadota bacterium]|jgi:TonB family protein